MNLDWLLLVVGVVRRASQSVGGSSERKRYGVRMHVSSCSLPDGLMSRNISLLRPYTESFDNRDLPVLRLCLHLIPSSFSRFAMYLLRTK